MKRFRGGEVNVVPICVASGRGREVVGLIVNALEDDRNFVGRQQVGDFPGVTRAGEDDPVRVGGSPLNGGFDLAHVVGVHHHRQVVANVRKHRFPGGNRVLRRETTFAAGVPGLCVGAGVFKEIVQRPDFFAPFLRLIFQRFPFRFVFEFRFGRGVEFHGRPEDVQGDRLSDRHVLGRPAVRDQQTGLARHDPAAGNWKEMGDAVGARHGNQFGIRIHGHPRLNVRRVLAHFGGIARGANRVDFDESQRSRSRDEAGIKMQAVQFLNLVRFRLDGFVNGNDLAVPHQDLAGRERRAGDRVHGRAAEEKCLGKRGEGGGN